MYIQHFKKYCFRSMHRRLEWTWRKLARALFFNRLFDVWIANETGPPRVPCIAWKWVQNSLTKLSNLSSEPGVPVPPIAYPSGSFFQDRRGSKCYCHLQVGQGTVLITHVSNALQCDALSLSRIFARQPFSSFLLQLEAKTFLIEECQPEVDFFAFLRGGFARLSGKSPLKE